MLIKLSLSSTQVNRVTLHQIGKCKECRQNLKEKNTAISICKDEECIQ